MFELGNQVQSYIETLKSMLLFLQVACRLIPRALGARAIATTPRAMSVSMKQPLDASASRGAVPSTDSYQKFMALQTHMTVSIESLSTIKHCVSSKF